MSDSNTTSWFTRFYRVMIPFGLVLFLITSYINLTGPLQPFPELDRPTGYPLLFRLAGAFLFGPISIGLGWMITRKFRDNLIGPVLIHWGCATSPNLGHSVLPPFWGALSLYYSMVVVLPGMVLMLASFPSGRGVSPFWDKVMKGLTLGLMGVFFLYNLSAPAAYGTRAPNPLAIEALSSVVGLDTLNSLVSIVLAISFFTGGSLTIYRYWITHAAERKQMRWLMGIVLFFSVYIPISTSFTRAAGQSAEIATIITLFFLFNVPSVGISLAILQHRLWDIDVIIRRTLQYSVISGILTFVYFGLITILQRLFFANQQSEISIVLSTLAIAALFVPLRNRVQDLIDGRFYRKKIDAQKVLAGFAAACRDETDLDRLSARLAKAVDETLQPEGVTVWLRSRAPAGHRSPADERAGP